MITIIHGTKSLDRDLFLNATVGDILNDANLRAVFGYGSNVEGLIGGVVQDRSTRLRDGQTIVIQTRANSKAADTYDVVFGSQRFSQEVSHGLTVAGVLNNASLRAVLGFGSNVEAHINGVAQPGNTPVRAGHVLTLVTRANSKAL